MPIAKPDQARTLRDVPVVIAVLGNDEGGNLSISGYTLPPAGALVLNPDQSFTYTPAAGFSGTDGFAYTVRDQLGGTAHGEVTIVVARPNSTPTATSDTASVAIGGSVDVPVLANDNDPEGDPLAIIGVDAPAHGTISVQPDQSIRYTPQPGFDGIDSFTYTVGDGAGAISTANVTVAVTVPNAPPQARPDQAATIEGTAVTIDALANDNDPEGGPISLSGMSLPGHGDLALTPDLRFVYTPDAGFVGPDSFSYAVRDEQGASSTGIVTVDVARQNSAPVANADTVISAGQPVVVDPLANDSDPDGDALRLTALTLPVKGQIALNPDGKVTYTPPTGFTGQDGFTYQVSDGTVVTEGEVAVSVTAPAVPTYANGFRYRRRIVVPAQAAVAETVSDFVLLVRETGTWLKQVAAAGRLQHPQGFDLRFELENGTKLDHELERYDASAGSILAWVGVPSWQLSSQLRLVLYYGKPELAATEANPASVWRGYLAVLDARTGADRSGANRALTPTGIGPGALLGDAGAYSGSSVASRADAAFLSGASALTVQALVAPNATMVGSNHGVLAQGPMNGTDASAGLTLQYLAATADCTRNAIHFKVACGDGAASVVSGADTQRAQRQLLHGVWRQGQAPRLFLDGAELPPSSSVVRSGVTAMPAGGLYLGAGARDPATGGWSGLIDEVRFAAAAFTPTRIACEARNLAATQALYGLGGEDEAGQIDAAPVAVPVTATLPTGSSIDIDVALPAYDPDGPGLPEVVAAVAPAHGVVTVVSGKIRYTPFAGYVGPDQFTFTLDNAGKRSSSVAAVSVLDVASELPPALRTITVSTAAQLTAALAGDFSGLPTVPTGSSGPLRSGDHIACAPGTYAGTFTMSVGGTQTSSIFIKRSSSAGVVTFTGKFNLRGAWCGLHRLRFTGNGTKVDISARGGCVTRCLFDGNDVGGGGIVYFTGGSHPDLRIDHNEFRSIVGAAIRSEITDAAAHQNMRIERNYFNGHSRGGDNEAVIMVLTDAYADADMFIERNLFSSCLNNFLDEKEAISVKTSGVSLVGNTFINCNGGFISFRVSSRSVAERNWLENGSFIKIHGDDHVLRGNRSTGKLAELHAGNCTMDSSVPAVCSSFSLAGRAPVVNKGTTADPNCVGGHPAVRNCLFEHNIGSIEVGRQAGTDRSFAVTNTILRNNDRAANRIAGGWSGITETAIGQQVNSAVRLTAVDVGPDAA